MEFTDFWDGEFFKSYVKLLESEVNRTWSGSQEDFRVEIESFASKEESSRERS